MAGDARAVENRLNQNREGKGLRAVRTGDDLRRLFGRRDRFNARNSRRSVFVTPDAACRFARLQVDERAHSLNHAPVFVESLEQDRGLGGRFKERRAVFLDRNRSQELFARRRERESYRRIVCVRSRLRQHLNDSERLNLSRNLIRPTLVNVLQEERSGRFFGVRERFVERRRGRRRNRTLSNRYRPDTRDVRIAINQFAIPERVAIVNPELVRNVRTRLADELVERIRRDEVFFREREGRLEAMGWPTPFFRRLFRAFGLAARLPVTGGNMVEVGLGADLTAAYEAREWIEALDKGTKLTTSCCPAFVEMIRKNYPDIY